MKKLLAISLLLLSGALMADRPDCSLSPGDCRGGVPSGRTPGDKVQSVPEPGTLALIGLGVAGLVMARRRKK